MNVEALTPAPFARRPFRRSHQKFVPNVSGCYVLTTNTEIVLYVGLAVDLRRRMGEHLDTPAKVAETPLGRAIWFHWLPTPDTNKVERTWMNTYIQAEGALPLLNRVYSPTHT